MRRNHGVILLLCLLVLIMAGTTLPCLATDTVELETATVEITSGEDLETESSNGISTPQVSWWARLLSAIGLGPLAAIAGLVCAVIVSGVVIAIVCVCDWHRRRS